MKDRDDNLSEAVEQLTDTVKSRILDQVISDLRDGLKLGSRADGYTKSDSGIYGKYQKHTSIDFNRVLEAIRVETERLLAEHMADITKREKQSESGKS